MANPPPLIRTATLSLARPIQHNDLNSLPFPPGLGELLIRDGGRKVRVSYDLQQTDLSALEFWFAASGHPLSSRLTARWYRQWRAFKDDNRLDQYRIVHQCCNLPPKGK